MFMPQNLSNLSSFPSDFTSDLGKKSSMDQKLIETRKKYSIRFRYKYVGQKPVSRNTEYLLFSINTLTTSGQITVLEMSHHLFQEFIVKFFSYFITEKAFFDQIEWVQVDENVRTTCVYPPVFGRILDEKDSTDDLAFFDFQHENQNAPSHFTVKFSNVPYIRKEAGFLLEKVSCFSPLLTEPITLKTQTGACTFRVNRLPLRKTLPEYGPILSIHLQYCSYKKGRKRKTQDN